MTNRVQNLKAITEVAITACQPQNCLPAYLPEIPDKGKLIVLGAGKAASAMAEVTEKTYLAQGYNPGSAKVIGQVTTRHGYATPTKFIKVSEAGHPIPDEASVKAATEALHLAQNAGPEDLILILLSGGASAIWCAPLPGLTLQEKQALTNNLLRSGMPIHEINTVRKHISAIKGGRLAKAAGTTHMQTLAISDVPGDLISAIGSGPTTGDDTKLQDARAILKTHKIPIDEKLDAILSDPKNETPDSDDAILSKHKFKIIASAKDAVNAAAIRAKELGYQPQILGDAVEGEARHIARKHAKLAIEATKTGIPTALISGGELTVTVQGHGIGGPNQEYITALLATLKGQHNISAIALDTDGADGGDGHKNDPAGAFITPETWEKAQSLNLNPAIFLANNDAGGFFARLEGLIVTGPTHTNVNDIRVILIEP